MVNEDEPLTRDEVESSPWRSRPGLQHYYDENGVLAMTWEYGPAEDVDPRFAWWLQE